ncbi:MAG TPA: AraC family transcriptional regulator [Frankiaceae bacterium]|nr:AraC family transcriptional regulator [Frankiaceae bacterium]
MTGQPPLPAPAGLLKLPGLGDTVHLARQAPGSAAAALVELYWSVSWDIPPGQVQTQETLPYPSIHLVVEDGRALVYGVPRSRFVRELTGRGSVLGIKFLPGGFRPLMDGPVSSLRGRVVPAEGVLAGDAPALVTAVLGAEGSAAQSAAAESWLAPLLPAPDPLVAEATRAVAAIADNPALLRVADLARDLSTSMRSLQRLFTEYVGVSAKWVVRRFRMHEAAARASEGPVDWAQVALDLGYYDQSHFIRDFTAAVGVPPARFAAQPKTPDGR